MTTHLDYENKNKNSHNNSLFTRLGQLLDGFIMVLYSAKSAHQ